MSCRSRSAALRHEVGQKKAEGGGDGGGGGQEERNQSHWEGRALMGKLGAYPGPMVTSGFYPGTARRPSYSRVGVPR